MKITIKTLATPLVVGAMFGAAGNSWATNGFFTIGYGSKSRGMAGVAIALPQDAMAAASNPAGISFVGDRADAGLELFNPNRDATLDATGMFGARSSEDSGATLFLVPHAGFVKQMDDYTASFVMYANGGMNTRYNRNIYANAFGPAVPGFAGALGVPVPNFPNTGTLGVNLAQLILAPSIAYKLNEDHSVGVSLLVGYQRFRAYGLGIFTGFSSDPNALTNNGDDDAWGSGLRLGWTGRVTDRLTLGATYSTKINMQEFDDYRGLFSDHGDLDIPANFGVGLAFQLSPAVTVGLDVTRILYSDVNPTGNRGPTGQEFVDSFVNVLNGNVPINRALGENDGFGFGWDDQTVYKLGVAWRYSDKWTFRGGFNYGASPIDDQENLFNIISLAVVEKHITLGFTYAPNDRNELTVAYMRALPETQSYTYTATAPAALGGAPLSYTTDISMDQHALEFSYAWKF